MADTRDDLGLPVDVGRPVRRVVSLVPSLRTAASTTGGCATRVSRQLELPAASAR